MAAGHSVRTLSLNEPQPGSLPDEIEVRFGDVTNVQTVADALQGIEIVVHLAALLHITNPSERMQERYEQVNVGGTRIIMEEAAKAGAGRVVYFSTIAVYGDPAGQVLDEDTIPRPTTLYGRSKLDAERIVLSATRGDGKSFGTVLRMPDIYGSRLKGNYRRLVTAIERGGFVPIGTGKNRRTLIYDRDAARAAVLAASHPAAAGQIYNVSDGGFRSMNEIIRAICDGLGRNPPRISVPAGPVRLAAGILEGAARIVGRKPAVTRSMVDKYTIDVAVDTRKIQAGLGFTPEYSLTEGWRDAIHEMRRAGDI
jgi:UDP-glucose 4-epimerase